MNRPEPPTNSSTTKASSDQASDRVALNPWLIALGIGALIIGVVSGLVMSAASLR